MAARGRPKGTAYPLGRNTAVWLSLKLHRGGSHGIMNAAVHVAKHIPKVWPTLSKDRLLSAERLRHMHMTTEKRRASDAVFESETDTILSEKKGEIAGAKKFLALPCQSPDFSGWAVMILWR